MNTDDLQLLAFQYISEELPDVQIAEFESLLATSQPARDALCTAVELQQVLPAAFEAGSPAVVASPTRASSARNQVAFVTTMAAGLLILAGWQIFGPRVSVPQNQSVVQQDRRAVDDAESLVAGWSGAANLFADELASDLRVEQESTADPSTEAASASDEDSLFAPSWMVAAVDGSSPADDDEQDMMAPGVPVDDDDEEVL